MNIKSSFIGKWALINRQKGFFMKQKHSQDHLQFIVLLRSDIENLFMLAL